MTNNETVLCICVPAFNEEECIKPFFEETIKVLAPLEIKFKIIFIDDGSKDNTWNEIKDLSSKNPEIVKGISFSRNFGKDSAIISALELIKSDAYIIIDIDGQHPIELIPEFYKLWQTKKVNVINGIKILEKQKNGFRQLLSKLFNYGFFKLSGLSLRDSSDFKLIDNKVAKHIINCGDYYIFFRALTKWVGFKQETVMFSVKQRELGTTKWPTMKLIIYALNAILLYSYVPLYLLLVIGFLSLVLSGILFIKLIVFYFYGENPTGYSTLLAISLLTLSINVISIGILGLYLQKVLDQVKFRPRYIVNETI